MSSIYRLICLSHDPGIELDTEWQSGQDGRSVAETALRQPGRAESEEIRNHDNCDLVIGRYSASLVEVGYLPYNTNVHWVDVEWLRVLAVASEGTPFPRGWSAERVRRLRPYLNLRTRIPPRDCACINWAVDMRTGTWGFEHHLMCDGTGHHKTTATEAAPRPCSEYKTLGNGQRIHCTVVDEPGVSHHFHEARHAGEEITWT